MAQNKIFIGNLSFNVGEDALKESFAHCGDITEVAIPTDRDTGRPRGFAFITFETQQGAEEALSLNDTELDGRKIAVSIAQEKGARGGRR